MLIIPSSPFISKIIEFKNKKTSNDLADLLLIPQFLKGEHDSPQISLTIFIRLLGLLGGI